VAVFFESGVRATFFLLRDVEMPSRAASGAITVR